MIHGFPGETPDEAERTVLFAEATMDRARSELGNPYVTWGGAPFVLDVHSPIGRRPGDWGIEVVPPSPDHDLSLVRDYRVLADGALSSAGARRLAQRATGRQAISQNVWFRTETESPLAEVEEFTFLRAAHRLPMAEPLRRIPRHVWCAPEARLVLVSTATLLPWPASEESQQRSVALYRGEDDLFVQLTWPRDEDLALLGARWRADELARWFSTNDVLWGQETGWALVATLTRHGFLNGPAVQRVDLGWDLGQFKLAREAAVLATGQADDLILHSPLSGNTVRLRLLGHAVWLVLGQGALSVQEITRELCGERDLRPEITHALSELLCLGFVHTVKPGPAILAAAGSTSLAEMAPRR